MKKILMLVASTLMLASCATGVYFPGNSNFGLTTNVVLSQANYRIVRNLDVTIEINNTNLKRRDVEKSAYAELLRQANLTGSQALSNVIVEEVRRIKMNMVGFHKYQQYVSAHATVIEFLQEDGTPVKSIVVQSAAPKPKVENSPSDEVQEQINICYLAYLKKAGKLNSTSLSSEMLKQVNRVANTHSSTELEELMKGYDKSLEEYSN